MSTPTASGLREAKKRATARELAIAAYTLVRERGYDAVTIDDIAADAGYSRRTFANHYAGKPDAVVDGFLAHAAVMPGTGVRHQRVGEGLLALNASQIRPELADADRRVEPLDLDGHHRKAIDRL